MPFPSTPRPRRRSTWRRVGRVRTVARAKMRSTTAASEIRTALYASGAMRRVAYFTSGKLNPQMATINTMRKSVGTNIGVWRGGASARGRASMSVMRKARRKPCAVTAGGRCSGRSLTCGMYLSFALFADAANISQEGKLNILGVFDAVQCGTLPTVHPRAHLVVRLKGGQDDVGTHTVSLNWLNPQGQELWSSNGELNIGAPPPGVTEMDMPLIAAIDLPLDASGAYSMRIALDGEAHGEVRLVVRTDMAPMGATLPANRLVS